ncbi:hypothetical protein OIU84_010948 [Salix udensis]|uniref:DUF3475 domain-containing protein n=1 Tax=Salix udensis TaxID=889485 RepID=A0AAD6NWG8_9ROSI|nr:hypothetical protein OIU84_010948 [Salix udensis]
MSKVVNLWNYLSDREIHRLREEIVNSVGAKRLVAEDHDYLMDLALNEILENFRLIAKSVVWLGRKCKDPPFLLFQRFVNDPVGSWKFLQNLNKLSGDCRPTLTPIV